MSFLLSLVPLFHSFSVSVWQFCFSFMLIFENPYFCPGDSKFCFQQLTPGESQSGCMGTVWVLLPPADTKLPGIGLPLQLQLPLPVPPIGAFL